MKGLPASSNGVVRATRFGAALTVYRRIAILLLNTLLLFVFVNLALGLLFYWHDRGITWIGPPRDRTIRLRQVYPQMKEEEWRDLLQETWSRPVAFEPFTQFKERPSEGKYVNVSEHGYRMNKGPQPWPPQADAFNIFFFGGSTTFGYGVRDDETIPSALQDILNARGCPSRVTIYNFGRGFYYSSQEGVLFSRLLAKGLVSHLAIFLDGYNEFTRVPDEPAFTERFKRTIEEFSLIRRPLVFFRVDLDLPLFRAARAARVVLKRALGREEPGPAQPSGEGKQISQVATGIVERYLRNKALIEGMASQFGVRTLFVWQPTPLYKYDRRYHLFDNGVSGELVGQGYRTLDSARTGFSPREREDFLWLADLQESKREPLYVDMFHYTAAFSREIAARIAEWPAMRSATCRGAVTGSGTRKGGA